MPVQIGSSIHPKTTVGPISLTVADLDRSKKFYENVIGLTTLASAPNWVSLGTATGAELLEIVLDPSAVVPSRRATGLFHHAILLPSRSALGRSLSHLRQAGWPLSGAGDHLVSEALYLNDPDGNGIELYADRPRETWTYKNGLVEMDTLGVDIDSVIREGQRDGSRWTGVPSDTRMGHIHLKVTDLEAAGRFYHDIIGFDVTSKMPQALFLSAGGYHHHLGLNTWMSGGAPAPASHSVGLRNFAIQLPDDAELQKVVNRVSAAGISFDETEAGTFLMDPSHNGVRLVVSRY